MKFPIVIVSRDETSFIILLALGEEDGCAVGLRIYANDEIEYRSDFFLDLSHWGRQIL